MSDWNEDIDDELLPDENSRMQVPDIDLDLQRAGSAIAGAVTGVGIGEMTGWWPAESIPEMVLTTILGAVAAYLVATAWGEYVGL